MVLPRTRSRHCEAMTGSAERQVPEDGFGALMRGHLAEIERRNATVLDRVADGMLAVVERDGIVHTAGAGHSLALVLETFYRAGGLACVNPIWHPALLPLAGGATSTLMERTTGLAVRLLDAAGPVAGDIAFIFSNSGVNPVPVELAQALTAAGIEVVAVTSLPSARGAPARSGTRLTEVADHVIDTQVPAGDAAWRAETVAVGGLSSLSSVFVWNLLLARLAGRAQMRGVDLPLWSSANVEGGDDRNAALFIRYRNRICGL